MHPQFGEVIVNFQVSVIRKGQEKTPKNDRQDKTFWRNYSHSFQPSPDLENCWIVPSCSVWHSGCLQVQFGFLQCLFIGIFLTHTLLRGCIEICSVRVRFRSNAEPQRLNVLNRWLGQQIIYDRRHTLFPRPPRLVSAIN